MLGEFHRVSIFIVLGVSVHLNCIKGRLLYREPTAWVLSVTVDPGIEDPVVSMFCELVSVRGDPAAVAERAIVSFSHSVVSESL